MNKKEIRPTGIQYPNPFADYLDGYRDYGKGTVEDLDSVFPAPDNSLTSEERVLKSAQRFERFLPPFIDRVSEAYIALRDSIAEAVTRYITDNVSSLRRTFAGGIGSETDPRTYSARRELQQLADEYRIIRGRYESVPELYGLIRNWRSIHLLRGTLNGAAAGETPTRSFGIVWDLQRLTRSRVNTRYLDNAREKPNEKAEWFLDETYPDFDENNRYAPDKPVRFLDIDVILLLYAANNNNVNYIEEVLEDENWYLDHTFPEGKLVDDEGGGDTFLYDPEEYNVYLDVAGIITRIKRNHDGYYTNKEIVDRCRREFVPAWQHFEIVWQPSSVPSAVIGMAGPTVMSVQRDSMI